MEFLSKVLKVSTSTINNWGSGVEFEKAPHLAETALGYVHALAEVCDVLEQLVDVKQLKEIKYVRSGGTTDDPDE